MAMVSDTAMRQRAAETASRVECVGIKKTPNFQRPTPKHLGIGGWRLGVGFYCRGRLSDRPFEALLLDVFLVRSTDTRRADEQLLAVREGDVPPVGAIGAVLGLEAFHDDLGAL